MNTSSSLTAAAFALALGVCAVLLFSSEKPTMTTPEVTIQLGSRSIRTAMTTAVGTPVVPMWKAPMPTDDLRQGAGYPVLDNAEHALVWQPLVREDGAYNHYASLMHYQGRFFAMWANHPLGEDGPGQRILFAYSDEWGHWSDARELFAAPGPVKPRPQKGIHLKPDRWMEIDGRLYAVAFVFDAGEYAIARQVQRDGSFDSAFRVYQPPDAVTELPVFMVGVEEPTDAGGTAARIQSWYTQNHQVSWWGRFASTGQGVPRRGVDGATLIESFAYRAKDGTEVLLARNWGTPGNPVHNNRLYVSFRGRDKAWSVPYPTDIPDSPSRAEAIVMADGTMLLIGNQTAPWLDQALYLDRDPITVSISKDGLAIDRVFALRTGARTSYRFPGISARDHGFAYPSSILHDGWLYTLYSVSKEEMAITRVRLSDMGL